MVKAVKRKKLSLWVDAVQLQAFKEACKRKGVTMAVAIRMFVYAEVRKEMGR